MAFTRARSQSARFSRRFNTTIHQMQDWRPYSPKPGYKQLIIAVFGRRGAGVSDFVFDLIV